MREIYHWSFEGVGERGLLAETIEGARQLVTITEGGRVVLRSEGEVTELRPVIVLDLSAAEPRESSVPDISVLNCILSCGCIDVADIHTRCSEHKVGGGLLIRKSGGVVEVRRGGAVEVRRF